MLERFREFLAEKGLIPDGAKVLVGYSGGADSTCLLHLLHLAKVSCVAAYLHHGQRAEADQELEGCAAFAESLGIPFVSGRADVPRLAKDRGIGIEEAGREARYAFFEEAAKQTGCDLIATAHTKTDLAETVLLNMIRGTGLAGLSGIPVRRGNIIRPLLPFTRAETHEYCLAEHLTTIVDPTNADTRFARPRLREHVMPQLQQIHPAAEEAIARLASMVEEEDSFLDSAAAAALERGEIPLNGELRFLTLDAEVRFDRDYLKHLPPVLLKRAIRLVAEALGGKLDHEQTLKIADALDSDENKGSLTTEGGKVVFSWSDAYLHAEREDSDSSERSNLPIPGTSANPNYGWKLAATLEDANDGRTIRESLDVQVDMDGFRGPLHFRSVQPGDKLRPIGGTGTRKLSDLMGEAGLTMMARRRLPIICDIIGPIWVPGVALEERVRLAPGSKKALRLVLSPNSISGTISETQDSARAYANS